LKSRANIIDCLMRTGLLLLVLTLGGCTNADTLPEGRWTGSLTPMNHPDLQTDIVFDVSTTAGELSIVLIGPGGEEINVSEPVLEGDTLRYSFREPEQNALLTCALGRLQDGVFEGKCSDSEGKWALFRMNSP
jgi:hypothetical protein